MATSKRKRKARGRARAATTATTEAPRGTALAWWLAAATLLIAPFVVLPGALDTFRLPQRHAAEWLALASLLPLLPAVARAERPWAALLQHPAARAIAPLLLVASLSLATTSHPLHVRDGLTDLWIGAAALVGWSLAFELARLRRLLDLLLVPATPFALFGILQLHAIWRPLAFEQGGGRLEVTSLAGNPGDLGGFLVLPCLVAQANLMLPGRQRWWWGVLGACCLYALTGTRTLTAFAALLAGSAVLWARLMPRRRLLVVGAGGAVAVMVLLAIAAPLRSRLTQKVEDLEAGKIEGLLTGRLDGWRVAVAQHADHPWTGVGHGAYRAEFARSKLELLARGVPFHEGHLNPTFANAHNEILEVGADLGWPGLAALAWGVAVLGAAAWRAAARLVRPDAALLWGGIAALGVLCMAQFPLRVSLIAFPWLAFLAWGLAAGALPEAER